VDRAQEHLHYVVDICNDDLYILDAVEQDAVSSPFPREISSAGVVGGDGFSSPSAPTIVEPEESISSPMPSVGEAAAAGREFILSQCVNSDTTEFESLLTSCSTTGSLVSKPFQ